MFYELVIVFPYHVCTSQNMQNVVILHKMIWKHWLYLGHVKS